MGNKTRLTRPLADEYVATLDASALDEFRTSSDHTKMSETHTKAAGYTATGRNSKLMLSALKAATGLGRAHASQNTIDKAKKEISTVDLSPKKNPHPPKFVDLTPAEISNLKWAYEMLRRGDVGSASKLLKRQLYATGHYKPA